MSRLFKTTLRVRLDTPEGRKAWGYLVSRDKRERQLADDPYLETREKEDAFLQRVLETVERGARANPLNGLAALLRNAQPAPDTKAIGDDLDAAMDFMDSL